MSYPEGTRGWLKYARTKTWHAVEVVSRIDGTHTYTLRKNRTDFTVGPADLVVVVTA